MGELIWLLALVGACSESLDWAHGRGPTLRTWRAAPAEYREWLADRLAGYGAGYGYGYGEGHGAGDGDGYGEGYGYGDGDGYGEGHGYGYGAYGYGSGNGYGYGDGDGDGYGEGYGYGDGDGYGEGHGYGYGDRMAEDIVSVVLADGTELCGDVGDAARAAIGRLLEDIAEQTHPMTDPTIPPGPSALLAFVRPERDRGPILLATGEFLTEVRDGCASWDIGDYDMPMPDRPGLQVFEGWIEVDAGPDPDVSFRGSWRQLTHWEMCRVRFGLSPFGDDNA